MKSTTFTVRCTPEEKARWQNAAGDMKFNSWVKSALNVAAGEEERAPVLVTPAKKTARCPRSVPQGFYCYQCNERH